MHAEAQHAAPSGASAHTPPLALDVSRDSVADDGARSRKADDSADAKPDHAEAGGPVYVAHVALDRTTMLVDGRQATVAPGIAVPAEIKTGRRRVISYLLSPLQGYAHEAMRER